MTGPSFHVGDNIGRDKYEVNGPNSVINVGPDADDDALVRAATAELQAFIAALHDADLIDGKGRVIDRGAVVEQIEKRRLDGRFQKVAAAVGKGLRSTLVETAKSVVAELVIAMVGLQGG